MMATPNEQVSVTKDGRNIWIRFPYTHNSFWYNIEPNYVSLCLSRELADELEQQLHNVQSETK